MKQTTNTKFSEKAKQGQFHLLLIVMAMIMAFGFGCAEDRDEELFVLDGQSAIDSNESRFDSQDDFIDDSENVLSSHFVGGYEPDTGSPSGDASLTPGTTYDRTPSYLDEEGVFEPGNRFNPKGYYSLTRQVDQCNGTAPGTDDCLYRIVWNEDACKNGTCDRLMIFWAGGNQVCDSGVYDELLKSHADEGFLAACAQPFNSSEETGRYPIYFEYQRMNFLLGQIQRVAGSLWNEKNLLHAGSSHGATALLLAIASQQAFIRYPERWTGTHNTAVVLYEMGSNPVTYTRWLEKRDECSEMLDRTVGRYQDGSLSLRDCADGFCTRSDMSSPQLWHNDIVDIGAVQPPSPYSCEDFRHPAQKIQYRFVSCGGGMTLECDVRGDQVPDEQQLDPYHSIKDCPGVKASYASYPMAGHFICGGWNFGGAETLEWLEEIGW